MKKTNVYALTALTTAILLSGCNESRNRSVLNVEPAPEPIDSNILLSSNRLAFLNAAEPANSLELLGEVQGLVSGETLVSIDRRPQNGYLYGLGYNASNGTVTLYVIHPESLQATPVGATSVGGFVDGMNQPDRIGVDANTRFEIDFNPAVDRLRIISSAGENFRMNPNNGMLVDGNLGGTDPIAGLNKDGAFNGGSMTAQGTAYTNSEPNNGGVTTQYTIDENTDQLFIQNPPNAGVLSMGQMLSPIVETVLGLDITPGINAPAANQPVPAGSAHLLFKPTASAAESLALVDLTSGTITNITAINGADGARGLALQKPEAVPVIGLSADGSSLLRFADNAPNIVTTVAIAGVDVNESLVGIDIRPATGQLFALGVNHNANNASLYIIDPQTGTASLAVAGTTGGIAFVDAAGDPVDLPDPSVAGYGFDFNPTVDRIRATTSTGLNLRLNPTNGMAVDGNFGLVGVAIPGTNPDGPINGATSGASAAAYTNSIASPAGSNVTTLYVLDEETSQLTIQSPPNRGDQIMAMTLTLNGSPLMFSASNGFDIQSDVRVNANNAAVAAGSGYAALTVGSTTSLYRINLVNGNTENLGAIGSGMSGLRGLAVGQTHAK